MFAQGWAASGGVCSRRTDASEMNSSACAERLADQAETKNALLVPLRLKDRYDVAQLTASQLASSSRSSVKPIMCPRATV